MKAVAPRAATRRAALEGERLCQWCRGELKPTARSDAKFCLKRCRQAAHRFAKAVGKAQRAAEPMRLAIADPPYPGKSHYYRGHPDYAGEVDHHELIWRLCKDYDGWVLATSAEALPSVLAITTRQELTVRVGCWVRGGRNRPTAHPSNEWEPVIYWGGRQVLPHACSDVSPPGADDASRPGRDGYQRDTSPEYSDDTFVGANAEAFRAAQEDRLRAESPPGRCDVLIYTSRPRLTDPNRVIGAKPAAWCRWVFELLGSCRGDTLDDLYPGSGGVARAWELYVS